MGLDLDKMNFDITGELMAKKLLENHTHYKYDIRKNDDKYGCDLEIHLYKTTQKSWSKHTPAMVEIEHALDWKSEDIPYYWYQISFLKRKLFMFDWQTSMYTDNPKHNDIHNYFYMKFNKDMDNCFCQRMDVIINTGRNENKRSQKDYNKLIMQVDFNHAKALYMSGYWVLTDQQVVYGIENCIKYITDTIEGDLTPRMSPEYIRDYERLRPSFSQIYKNPESIDYAKETKADQRSFKEIREGYYNTPKTVYKPEKQPNGTYLNNQIIIPSSGVQLSFGDNFFNPQVQNP